MERTITMGSAIKDEEQPKCLHCKGNGHAGSVKCLKRSKEVNMNKVRAEKCLA